MTFRFHCKKAVLLSVLFSLPQCKLLCSDFSRKRFEIIHFPPHHTHTHACKQAHAHARAYTHTHKQISFLFKSEHTYPLQIQICFIKHTFKITVYCAAMSHTLHTRGAQPSSFHENSSIIIWTQIYHLFPTALCHTPKDHTITAVRISNFTLRFMKQFWSCTRYAVLTVLLRIQTSGK